MDSKRREVPRQRDNHLERQLAYQLRFMGDDIQRQYEKMREDVTERNVVIQTSVIVLQLLLGEMILLGLFRVIQ